MTELLGITRNEVKERYALLTPGSFVASYVPGWEKAVCHVLISPALGAAFSQLLITLEKDGKCVGNTGANQYFVFLLEGAATILIESRKHRLEPGSYAYLPAGQDVQIASAAPAARLLVFQKKYQTLPGVDKPAGLVGHEREVKGQPFRGSDDTRLQALLPAQPAFDMAVNILTCQPGAALPAVEAPVMERGLLILRGQGIYRLEADWHPVQAGDAIWMAPYCPQWFVAMGKTPASCIYYQDVNRDPM
jgi:(S)-ureidoglycine aminohydrolase